MTARRAFARVVVVTAVTVLATWQVVHRDRHGPTDVTTSSAPSVERPVMATATPPLDAAPARPTREPVSSALQREALDAQDL